ncbi:Glycosyl transferases group 1 [Planctomycetes bacterium CA13]|uniref:tRNA-queuosine alpha-mannosyltransferase n=1 Tax=Novipirellula herctigrandis TaxID=2527986 RepID=A0A5C5Z1D1_9BACT|nr:Glycosyl transferases group 1 [Planctomycetes bacterium CA13]
MHFLFIEPYYGGSHRVFADSVVRHSQHQWTLMTGKPVHWKWRMRSSALDFAKQADRGASEESPWDALVCSSMLDLPTWRGLTKRVELSCLPTAVYFHENQWMYPDSPDARSDHHYGYTNLLTAIAADGCLFNSRFHLDGFLDAAKSFVRRMPDSVAIHDFDSLKEKSQVIAPGFDPWTIKRQQANQAGTTLRIGWVARWEYDKRPDRFVEFLRLLDRAGVEFNLVLLGKRGNHDAPALTQIRQHFGNRILFDDFVESVDEYRSWLEQVDFVVSTADHEFFGIAVCEAIWAGAVPVLPNRLSYLDWADDEFRYETLGEAVSIVQRLADWQQREQAAQRARQRIATLQTPNIVTMFDKSMEVMAGKPNKP